MDTKRDPFPPRPQDARGPGAASLRSGPPYALALFYFSHFGTLGILLPYFNLYLVHAGFSAAEIGLLAGIFPLVKILVPTLWGMAADRFQRRKGMILLTCSASLAAFSVLLWVRGFWPTALALAGFALFWAPILPMVEVTALEAVERKGFPYGRVRLWGSVGFILLTLGMGPVLDAWSTRAVLYGMLAGLLANTLVASRLPDFSRASRAPAPRPRFQALARSRGLWVFLACGMLMQLSHGTYYGFFSIALEASGYAKSLIGALWALGVVCEIGIMLSAERLMRVTGAPALLSLSFGLAAVRWGLTAMDAGLAPLVLAQSLHAFSFGAYHVASVVYLYRQVPPELRTTAQALYSSLSFGLGIALGLWLNGFFYDAWGPRVLFGLSAAVALGGGLLSLALHRATAPWGQEPGGEGP